MTTKLLFFLIFACLQITITIAQTIPYDSLYLGQTPPGNVPKVFTNSKMLKPDRGVCERIAITSDGKEIYYTEAIPSSDVKIKYFKYENNKWNGPDYLFSTFTSFYFAPTFSSDGKTLYFQSYENGLYKTYTSEKTADGKWSNPQLFNNYSGELYYFQVTDSGNYYEGANNISGGLGQWDLCKVIINGSNITIKSIGKPVNTANNDSEFYIAKDESYIVLGANEGGPGGRDLYICYKKKDGNWTNPKSLGNLINDGNYYKWGPYVSPDNKYLFYAKATNPNYSIYWVRFDSLLDSLKKTNYIPYLANQIKSHYDTVGYNISIKIPDSTFIDDDGNNTLNYSVALKNGDPIPSWLIFDATTKTFSGIAKEAGTYYIKVTATDTAKAGVSSLFNLFIKGNLSSVNDSENENIQLFPNPTSGKLTVIFDKYEVEQTVLKIFNQEGIAVFSKMYLNSKLAIVDLSSYPKGFYTVLFTNKMKSYRKQICMQ